MKQAVKGIELKATKKVVRRYAGAMEGTDTVMYATVGGQDFVTERDNQVECWKMKKYYTNNKNPKISSYEGETEGNGYTRYISGSHDYNEEGIVVKSHRTEVVISDASDTEQERFVTNSSVNLDDATVTVEVSNAGEEGTFVMPYYGEVFIDNDTLQALNFQMDKSDKFINEEKSLRPTGPYSFDVTDKEGKVVLSVDCISREYNDEALYFNIERDFSNIHSEKFTIVYSPLLGEVIYDNRPRVDYRTITNYNAVEIARFDGNDTVVYTVSANVEEV